MRISDWSSDVCSSDLAEVNDRFHKGLLEACGNRRLRDLLGTITEVPLQLSTFRRSSIDELRRSAAQHSELVSALAVGDADWARKLGRASCRERVCQYV